ncbi:putative lipase class 2 protein [Mycena indigotica]|uniref:Putative lipase class 2 protein n=1 Tax=Mycena indigotica TaxID=2126181 RepID=A0A8H6W0W1_9AGAR|nr:putative lipase class 2 protein [Mycena indigotica]KAF7295314.1 putative lipase class 2 protein [Mycena indigotica]
MRLQNLVLLPFFVYSASAGLIPKSVLEARNQIWDAIVELRLTGNPPNDFACRSKVHPNPVFLIHALSANPGIDLNLLQDDMKKKGYCTYTSTYGAHTLMPWIGGLTSMQSSVKDLTADILSVLAKTGASKIDLVGHSEGGVMSLYAPLKSPQLASKVERIVALGPAMHGAQYFGLTNLFYKDGQFSRDIAKGVLDFLGCPACDDMATGGAVFKELAAASQKYNGKPGSGIAPAGAKTTIIMSRSDTLVAPKTSIVNETGVNNIFVQDFCPDDPVGHGGLAWDDSVWSLVYNALEENPKGPIKCGKGLRF